MHIFRNRAVVHPLILAVGVLLIATNLRAPITGVAPVLSMIQKTFGISTAQAGLLTTLPLLAFALFSPVAAKVAQRYGLERALFGALLLIGLGILIRSLGPAAALFTGTALIGAGIALGNVLLPSLLKRDFPHRIAAMTGAYATTMAIAAAAASMIAVPLATTTDLGWRLALGSMLILPVAALVLWLPQVSNQTPPAQGISTGAHTGPIWRMRLAWQVTLFMGLNSFLYYVLIGWLPSILITSGYSPSQAGSLHGLMQLASGVPGLLAAIVMRRLKDQRAIAAGTSLLTMLSLLGLLLFPAAAGLWAPLFGFSAGAGMILALMFMGLRTRSSHQAAALSGMAQCVGYLLAAFGPPLVGALHDTTGDWRLALGICVVLALFMALAGLGSGRNIQMPDPHGRTVLSTPVADEALSTQPQCTRTTTS